ncbi:MAG: hypothetical protein H6734_18270 [Alphaproteobacteria bacterium]|nr:hypothetical protein [Alphaproteobacteria bacterium]
MHDVGFVRRVLRSLEYAPQVTAVQTGSELVVALRRGPADLVLAPFEPPDMLFRRLRYHLDASAWDGTLGVFADDAQQVQAALEAGGHFALRRPLDERTFVRALHHFRVLGEEHGPLLEDLEDSWSVALRRPFALGFTTDPIDLDRPGSVWVAEYGRKDGPVTALTVLDETLGLGLGAAVSLIPPVMTRELLRRRASNERLARNLKMVCELLVDLYADEGLTMRTLRRTVHVSRAIRTLARDDLRLDVEVDLKDYGRGRAAFLRLDGQNRPARRPLPAPTRVATPAPQRSGRFL